MAILRVNRVMDYMGVRRTSIHEAVKDGTLTRPIRVTTRAVGWPENEVQAVIAARIAGKSKAEIQALVNTLHAQRARSGAGTIWEVAPAATPTPQAAGLQLVGA
jgi:prophage regulatory protein